MVYILAFEQVPVFGSVFWVQAFVQLQVLAVFDVEPVFEPVLAQAPVLAPALFAFEPVRAQARGPGMEQVMETGLAQIPFYLGHGCRLLLNFCQTCILCFYL